MRHRVALLVAFALIAIACTNDSEPESSTVATAPPVVSESSQGATAPATEPAAEAADPALLEELPVDPEVRIGTLDNGLTYYIRFNDSPGGRAELRLAVNAGSVLEQPDQSGGAHFLEHMMFNGTEKYPVNDLISVLESFGPQFGPDINAYTSFDETVYELSVPTDNPTILSEAMEVLVQWADHANLTQTDVEQERGVVVEEWRVRDQGLDGRVTAAFGELVLTDTAYAGHLPIGEFESISTMDAEPLRRFYETWYRPDLMAVIVVGDVDVDEVESMIMSSFDGLINPEIPTPRPLIAVTPPSSPEAGVLADPESTLPSVDVFYMASRADRDTTVGSLQRAVATALAMQILDTRLSDDALRGNVPFFSASTFEFEYSREIFATGISISADAPNLEAAAFAVLTEVGRVREFGFTDQEYDRVVQSFEALIEQLREGQDSRQDEQFAGEYVAHFLAGTPIPSVDQLYGIQQEILARLTRVDVETAFNDLVTKSAPRVFVVGPDAPASSVPTVEQLLGLVERAGNTTLDPRPQEPSVPDQLMDRPPETDPIAVGQNEVLGYLEIEYGNGARVAFWPTDIADSLISFGASSFGGVSQVAVEDQTEAQLGVEMIAQSGLGELDQVTVERVLSNQIVSFVPYIDNTHEGFTGSAATEDLETLFQLINLSIAAPRINDVAVSTVLTEIRPRVEAPEDVPRLLATIAYFDSYYGPGDDRHWAIPPLDEFNAFDPVRALEVYNERFSNPGEFLFVFVGDADADTFLALSNSYIGSLVGAPGAEGFIDHQPLPRGEQITTVEAGQDDQGLVQLGFTNEFVGQSGESEVIADLLELIANNRLRDRIREKLSATYSPFLSVDLQLEPDPYVESYVEVSGDPDRLDEIASEVLADLADLRTNGPTTEQLSIAQEQLFREYELVNNPFLVEQVIFFEEHDGRDISELIDRYDIIATITTSDIRSMSRLAFPVGHYIEVKLIPAA